MDFDFNSNEPLYKQIAKQLAIQIIVGTYKIGSRIPSVREIALLTKTNPNTVQRSLTELEEEGLIITKRTSGKFITEDKAIIEKYRHKILKETVDKFIIDMNKLNITKAEIISYLKENKQ